MSYPSSLAALGCAALIGSSAAQPLINEFEPNPLGGGVDPATQQIELIGTPLASFNGVLVSIESDPPASTTTTGRINDVAEIVGSFDANGLLVVTIDDFENPSWTLVLADAFTGNTVTDLDTDNDGTIDDFSFFGTVYDAVGVSNNIDDQATLYGTDFGGTDIAYTGGTPKLIFRDATTSDWYALNAKAAIPDEEELYNAVGDNVLRSIFAESPDPTTTTFGSPNPATIGTAIPGDTDGDGDIDDSDLGTSFANYTGPLALGSGTKAAADGDTDGDGDVDDTDLGTSFAGYTGPLSPNPGAAVPEPTGLALLGLGVFALHRRRLGAHASTQAQVFTD